MTCPHCEPWCATSEEHLAGRLQRMASVPGSTIHPCERCGGIDWATSPEKIKPDMKKRPWWLRWNPPSWRYLRVAHILAAASLLWLAWLSGASVAGMVDMFTAGFNAAAAFYLTFQMRSQKSFDRLMTINNELMEINRALIANRVEMHVMSMHRGSGDDSPPTAPTLQ